MQPYSIDHIIYIYILSSRIVPNKNYISNVSIIGKKTSKAREIFVHTDRLMTAHETDGLKKPFPIYRAKINIQITWRQSFIPNIPTWTKEIFTNFKTNWRNRDEEYY